MRDLRAIINNVAARAKELTTKYGNVATTSVGAIQRRLLVLEEQGADHFFGEPALDIWDFIRTAPDGRGVVNILAADKLMEKPRLYATFLLWMLTKLWQTLPEVGDQPKPKLVFFFDEAHLLFDDAPKALMDRIEQIARLVRSKGVGVYFITQNPMDVPNTVSAQLGNRVQHALRAFTPQEQRAVKAAAETFRPNPELDTERVILELKVGRGARLDAGEQGRAVDRAAHAHPPAARAASGRSPTRSAAASSPPARSTGKYETVEEPRERRGDARPARSQAATKEAEASAAAAGPTSSSAAARARPDATARAWAR